MPDDPHPRDPRGGVLDHLDPTPPRPEGPALPTRSALVAAVEPAVTAVALQLAPVPSQLPARPQAAPLGIGAPQGAAVVPKLDAVPAYFAGVAPQLAPLGGYVGPLGGKRRRKGERQGEYRDDACTVSH